MSVASNSPNIVKVIYLFQAFLTPLMSIITGNERMDVASIFEFVGQAIFMGAGALFLFAGLDFVWLVVAGMRNIPVLILMASSVISGIISARRPTPIG